MSRAHHQDILSVCVFQPHSQSGDIHHICAFVFPPSRSPSICGLPRLLNKIMMALSNVLIQQPTYINTTCYGYIIREWVKQNTQLRDFSYSCNTASIWLSFDPFFSILKQCPVSLICFANGSLLLF
jgi:hypothetical protein